MAKWQNQSIDYRQDIDCRELEEEPDSLGQEGWETVLWLPSASNTPELVRILMNKSI